MYTTTVYNVDHLRNRTIHGFVTIRNTPVKLNSVRASIRRMKMKNAQWLKEVTLNYCQIL